MEIGEREIATEIGEREMGSKLSEEENQGNENESDDSDDYCDSDGDYDSDDDIGGGILFYDRDSPESGEPNGLQYFQSMVKLAIDFYNKDKAEKYSVVELIKLFGVAGAGDCLSLNFTAKLDDSDPVNFNASMFNAIEGTNIEYVGINAESAI